MRKLALVIFLFSFLFLASLSAERFSFRFHQFLPKTSSIPREFIEPWIKTIEKDSGGRIQIKHYPSMQLGGTPATLINQVIDGTVDFVWTLQGYTPGRFPLSEVFELPFMVTTAEGTSKAFYAFYEKYLQDEYRDFKVIAVHTHGVGLIHSHSPIRSLSDISGKKIRGPTRVITSFLDALGAVPIAMPVPRVPEALMHGVIDGAMLPWQVTMALKTSEQVGHHTRAEGVNGLYAAIFVVAMHTPSYEKLPPTLQGVIDKNSGLQVAARMGQIMDAEDAIAEQKASNRGNTLITLTKSETQKWKRVGERVTKNWIDQVTKKGHDGTLLVREASRLIGENTK